MGSRAEEVALDRKGESLGVWDIGTDCLKDRCSSVPVFIKACVLVSTGQRKGCFLFVSIATDNLSTRWRDDTPFG